MHRRTGACRTTIVEYDFVDGPQAAKLKDKKYREGMYECVIKAICRHEGVQYKPPYVPKPQPEPSKGIYKVQVGAFAVKDNAERLAAELKAKGYSTYIVHE